MRRRWIATLGTTLSLFTLTAALEASSLDAKLIEECHSFGRIPVVLDLLERGARIDARDRQGISPLHYAASNAFVDLVNVLVDRGAPVDATDQARRTPLMFAAGSSYQGSIKIVTNLIGHGADIDRQDKWGGTPLSIALIEGMWFEKVQILVEAGAEVNTQESLDWDVYGNTPLHHAVGRMGSLRALTLLLEAGAGDSVDVQNARGETPVMNAVNSLRVACVKRLVALGPDLDLQDREGRTALMVAARVGDSFLESTRALLAGGAGTDLVDRDGKTALAIAEAFASRDDFHHETVKLLRQAMGRTD